VRAAQEKDVWTLFTKSHFDDGITQLTAAFCATHPEAKQSLLEVQCFLFLFPASADRSSQLVRYWPARRYANRFALVFVCDPPHSSWPSSTRSRATWASAWSRRPCSPSLSITAGAQKMLRFDHAEPLSLDINRCSVVACSSHG